MQSRCSLVTCGPESNVLSPVSLLDGRHGHGGLEAVVRVPRVHGGGVVTHHLGNTHTCSTPLRPSEFMGTYVCFTVCLCGDVIVCTCVVPHDEK